MEKYNIEEYLPSMVVYYMDMKIWYGNSYWLFFMSNNQYGSKINKKIFTSRKFRKKTPGVMKNSARNPSITEKFFKNPYSVHGPD